eukprot:12541-Heterococcus_DN1.PRE.1
MAICPMQCLIALLFVCRCMHTDEECLSKGLGNCFDSWMAASLKDKTLITLGYKPYQWTVLAACWGADCITLKAVSKR